MFVHANMFHFFTLGMNMNIGDSILGSSVRRLDVLSHYIHIICTELIICLSKRKITTTSSKDACYRYYRIQMVLLKSNTQSIVTANL